MCIDKIRLLIIFMSCNYDSFMFVAFKLFSCFIKKIHIKPSPQLWHELGFHYLALLANRVNKKGGTRHPEIFREQPK